MAKLNIGAGEHPLDGWINIDIGGHPGTLRMDATQPFPFPDNHFSHIFCEHMIEHVSFNAGERMLRECFRTLIPGGRIRVSTPSWEFLTDLLLHETELTRRYVDWACGLFAPTSPVCAETVVNNFVRAWGHQFIYSERLLRRTLQMYGFREVDIYAIQDSVDPELQNLENDTRMPPGFLQLETMTLEGVKPLA